MIVRLFIVLLALLGTAPATAQRAPASAKSYVDALYQTRIDRSRLDPRRAGSPAQIKVARYGPNLERLLEQDARIARAGGGMNLVDADPFCDCQDFWANASFTSTVAATGPDSAVVTVLLRNGPETKRFRIDMAQDAKGWTVLDIHSPRHASFVAYLRKNLPTVVEVPAPAGPAAAKALPPRIAYSGVDYSESGQPDLTWRMELSRTGSELRGTGSFQGRKQRKAVEIDPVLGRYVNGNCEVVLARFILTGPCDAGSFKGKEYAGGAYAGTFALTGQTLAVPSPADTRADIGEADRPILRSVYALESGGPCAIAKGDDPGTTYGPPSVEWKRDINGDGSLEALVIEGGTFCYGNTGTGFWLLTQSAAGWRVIAASIGIADLRQRKGPGGWPDIEVGGPGLCFPLLRWQGDRYGAAGHSYGGKPCRPGI